MEPADRVISLHTRGCEDAMIRKIGGSTALFAQHALRRYRVGSGVSLVGICLAHVKASKVILSDGDLSTLSYMKLNLKMNRLSTDDDGPVSSECTDSVKCLHLPWECASESELQGLKPDIILGADVIYDPLCPPHLVCLLSILVDKSKSSS